MEPDRCTLSSHHARHTKLLVKTGEITSSEGVDVNTDAAKKDCAKYIERQSNANLLVSILRSFQIYTEAGSAFCRKY